AFLDQNGNGTFHENFVGGDVFQNAVTVVDTPPVPPPPPPLEGGSAISALTFLTGPLKQVRPGRWTQKISFFANQNIKGPLSLILRNLRPRGTKLVNATGVLVSGTGRKRKVSPFIVFLPNNVQMNAFSGQEITLVIRTRGPVRPRYRLELFPGIPTA